ncbi:AcrR family transcriptional regulator [Kibdelosporangium banguiense]|uniref:AcrR family transcriptional regulator n=1 Tax=Kibdelosporangium banguiense TaxID=1365924 RepID=A0ABS4TIS4_9PSEU|nr:TetR/AcrR family transcriptional regulator [Kibdelosporangium banguiense]MBP2324224.1 AcrR family transcriptional regulator [Kibdelosporangium banguiense]
MDPRAENSRRAIRRAALAELAEAGYGGFALDSVAARAGVGRSTVYRHWNGKLPLIADALETLNEQPGVQDIGGTARERVEILLRHLAEVLVSSPFSRCVPALVHAAEQDAMVRSFHHEYSARRRQALVRVIASGVQAGEFPATVDPEIASLALSGVVFYRRLMTGDPVDPSEVPALMDAVLGPPAATRLKPS